MSGRSFDPPSTSSVSEAARRGGRLGIGAAAFDQLSSVLATIVLARILSPSDFGIVAAANTVRALLATLLQVGLTQALVKRERVDDTVASTLWWTMGGISLVASLVMAALAFPFALAIGIRGAAPYIALLAPVLVLNFTASIPRGLLQRQWQFKQLYGVAIIEAAVYATTEIVLAAAGAGAASVVIAQVLDAAVAFTLYHVLLGWRPSRSFDHAVIREERRFSSWMFVNTTLAWGGKNADYFVVGRIGDARRLGIYYIAFVLPNIIRQRLTWTITEVLFPVLARIRDDLERFRAAYLRVLQLLVAIGLPVLVGIALLADDVIAIFFGSKWSGARAPMQILAMAALVELLTQVATTIFLADGEPKRSAGVEAVRFATLAAGLGVAAAIGSTRAVAVAVLVASFAAAIAAQVQIGRRLQLSSRALLGALMPIVQPTCVMAGAVVLLDRATDLSRYANAAVLSSVGAAVYVGVGFALFGATYRVLARESIRLVGLRGG